MSEEVPFDPTEAMLSQQTSPETPLSTTNEAAPKDNAVENTIVEDETQGQEQKLTVASAREKIKQVLSQMDPNSPEYSTLQRVDSRDDEYVAKVLPTLTKYFDRYSSTARPFEISLKEGAQSAVVTENEADREENLREEKRKSERISTIKRVLSEKTGLSLEEIDDDFIEAVSRGLTSLENSVKSIEKKSSEELVLKKLRESGVDVVRDIYKDYLRERAYNSARTSGLSDEEARVASQVALLKYGNELKEADGDTDRSMEQFKDYLAQVLGQRVGGEVMRMRLTPDIIGLLITELGRVNTRQG